MLAKKNKSKDKAIFFHEDNSCSIHKVIEVLGQSIETDKGLYDISDAKKVYDYETGGCIYLYHVDIPAKVEAENLKNLRRSVTLKRMFNYEKGKSLDIVSMFPWIALLASIIFR